MGVGIEHGPEESPDHIDADGRVRSVLFGLASNPARSLALGIVVILALLYGVFIQQELLLVVWLLAVGFLVYLFWRFVRPHERIAGATERLAPGEERGGESFGRRWFSRNDTY